MERLRELRRAKGWSQQRLADEAGVDRTTISFAETDAKRPHLDTLGKLADALGVEPGELLGKAEPSPEREEPQREEKPPEPEIDPVTAAWLRIGQELGVEPGVEFVRLAERQSSWNPTGKTHSPEEHDFLAMLPASFARKSPGERVRVLFDWLIAELRAAGASAAEIARVERERARALQEIAH